MPERIQLQRTRGWRMPADTVKVDRSTKWGNPFTMEWARERFPVAADDDEWLRRILVDVYRTWLRQASYGPWWTEDPVFVDHYRIVCSYQVHELRGLNLACWCPDGSPCHADVLLEIANSETHPAFVDQHAEHCVACAGGSS